MPLNLELSEEEALCLHRYFERVDETEDLSFRHPAEYLAFQRIAGQVVEASAALLKSNRDRVLDLACHSVVRGIGVAPKALNDDVPPAEVVVSIARRLLPQRRTIEICPPAPAAPVRACAEALVRECARAFETGEQERIVKLFAIDARIISPFLGCSTPRTFVSRVAHADAGARLTIHDVLNIERRPRASGYFLYDGSGDFRSPDAPPENHGVFNYVLHLDPAAKNIQSMIIL